MELIEINRLFEFFWSINSPINRLQEFFVSTHPYLQRTGGYMMILHHMLGSQELHLNFAPWEKKHTIRGHFVYTSPKGTHIIRFRPFQGKGIFLQSD